MPQSLGTSQVFFVDAVRVDEGLGGIHADFDWTKELRYRFAFSLCEELSSCGGVVGDKRARYA
jgi:hypothetical protein